MGKHILVLHIILLSGLYSKSQVISDLYLKNIALADSFLSKGQYQSATFYYNQAFISNGNKGKVIDRYNDAKCWVILNNKDSAFFQLDKIANGGKFTKYEVLESDLTFLPLKSDPRWQKIIAKIKSNAH
jgi:hypothetical protein